MSKWDDFKKSVGIIADRTVAKTRELTDTASLKIKIATKEADRDTEYKVLGKLTYAKLKKLTLPESEPITERISETIERIDALNAEINALKAEEKARRAAKEAEKAAKEAMRAEEEAAAEENGEAVMEQFNKARQEADREYEAAKEAANRAKNAADETPSEDVAEPEAVQPSESAEAETQVDEPDEQ